MDLRMSINCQYCNLSVSEVTEWISTFSYTAVAVWVSPLIQSSSPVHAVIVHTCLLVVATSCCYGLSGIGGLDYWNGLNCYKSFLLLIWQLSRKWLLSQFPNFLHAPLTSASGACLVVLAWGSKVMIGHI